MILLAATIQKLQILNCIIITVNVYNFFVMSKKLCILLYIMLLQNLKKL